MIYLNVLKSRIYENIKDSEIQTSKNSYGDVEVMFSSEDDGEISFMFSPSEAMSLATRIQEAANATNE